jgi:processive 1,2-diacylglycerol beta-glucosyltransferase
LAGESKILILTLSFGSGHLRAAETVGAEFSRRQPGAEIKIIDALEGCRLPFRAFYVWTYWLMIRFVPNLWGKFFASRVKRKEQQTAPVWAWRWGCSHVFEQIERFQPDLIVCCEVGASELAVIAKREGLTRAEIINVITDFEAEPIWVTPDANLYLVPNESVGVQLQSWGAPAGSVKPCGIPIDIKFRTRYDDSETRKLFGLDDRRVVLLMGGGMGPTRMDVVAAGLLKSGQRLQIVAFPGGDTRAARRLSKLSSNENAGLTVITWTDDIARLMQAATLLITKGGGLTLAEAAASALPVVLFDLIPGPENSNASHFVDAGAAVSTANSAETAAVVLDILNDESRLETMSRSAARLAEPRAAEYIVDAALGLLRTSEETTRSLALCPIDGPVLILTISNGHGHIRLAESLANAIKAVDPYRTVRVVDVADYMTRLVRFSHVTAYLWLVKYLPGVWDRIDRFQNERTTTSPAWYYRNGCRRLFDLVRETLPAALIATEVGCCEIAALIKKDLKLDIPLVAVNGELDTDLAWIKPEVDLYSCVTDDCRDSFIANGARPELVKTCGPFVATGFQTTRDRVFERRRVCERLGLDPAKPLILIAGGSEGIGLIEQAAAGLLHLTEVRPQLIVLAGRNERLKERCEMLTDPSGEDRLRVLGWTDPDEMPGLFAASDLIISKLGSIFNEAVAARLPIVTFTPPPGAERLQLKLLEQWRVGKYVETIDEMSDTVVDLLSSPAKLEDMRQNALRLNFGDAARDVAEWLRRAKDREQPSDRGFVLENIADRQVAVDA